jgi:hypothetical protein
MNQTPVDSPKEKLLQEFNSVVAETEQLIQAAAGWAATKQAPSRRASRGFLTPPGSAWRASATTRSPRRAPGEETDEVRAGEPVALGGHRRDDFRRSRASSWAC